MRKISRALRWCYRRLPEALLVFFLLALAPLVWLVGRSIYRITADFVRDPGIVLGSLSEYPWTALAVVVCAAGTALLIYLVLRHRQTVWAVARKMIMEALSRKVVIILLIFFAVLMPSLPFVLKTEGSVKSQVQLVLLYSLCLALVLLSLLAIFLSTASICSEVEKKQVHVTDTKPMARWQFLLGKWLGVVVLCTAVLAVMTAGTYGLICYLAREPDYSKMTKWDVAEAKAERRELRREVFVARRSASIPPPQWTPEMEKELREWHEKQPVRIAVWSHKQSMLRTKWREQQSVVSGRTLKWKFSGLDPDQPGRLQVRFRAISHRGGRIMGRFVPCYATKKKTKTDEGQAETVLRRAGPGVWSPAQGWRGNTFHQVELSPEYISDNGTLWLVFENWTPQAKITFSVEHPIEVLQQEEGFLLNYYRSLMVLLFHIALISALGLLAGSLFSFPVASLLVICFFVGGLLGGWFHGEFVEPDIYNRLSPETRIVDQVWRGFAGFIVALLPDFSRFSPLGLLVDGRIVGMKRVLKAGSALVFLKGGLAMVVAAFFYTRRELARIIV